MKRENIVYKTVNYFVNRIYRIEKKTLLYHREDRVNRRSMTVLMANVTGEERGAVFGGRVQRGQ